MSHLSETAPDVLKYIFSFIRPEKYLPKLVRECARSLVILNKDMYKCSKESIKELKRIHELVLKYNKYNEEYEDPKNHWAIGAFLRKSVGSPHLIDALLTESNYPFGRHSVNKYSSEVEQDIKDIVRLMPESINCDMGVLRCRDNVTPFFIACLNTSIPIHIIKHLIESGANYKGTITLNCRDIPLLEDLRECDLRGSGRYDKIMKLL